MVSAKRGNPPLGCCSHRHPNIEFEKSYQYSDRILTKISRENKLVFCMGDQFEVNLSNCNVHTYTNDVGNIFSNNTVHEAIIDSYLAGCCPICDL